MVCLSIALYAVCDSFASGSGDALAYDSLKSAGKESEYDRYESNQLIIYRLFGGISTLCAGFALIIGYRMAYATGIVTCLIQLGILLSMKEIHAEKTGQEPVAISPMKALFGCFRDSLRFLKTETKAFLLMMSNSLVGAADILLLFLGGIIGAKMVLRFRNCSYRGIFLAAAGLVFAGIVLEHTGIPLLMTVGGLIAALADDALQVRTNTRLQNMFPSEYRATLISIECFSFSVIMIVLSPLAGFFFSVW